MFWKGQDGYCINIKQWDPVTGAETNKNVSSKDYAYRFMIRRGQNNVISRYREFCHQFMMDMYVKIESERLRYLRFNQQKLRADSLARRYWEQRRNRSFYHHGIQAVHATCKNTFRML
ncbi:helitron_like_N domain-containing protein [Trichonephila clavipes]|nr:helitron_like_N domain-containing protein [Trichonephila clavipes]